MSDATSGVAVISLVSVVIPAFNAQETLLETLLSASAQTYRDLEIIVVNDGSSDGTSRIVNAFSAVDSRVRLIEKPNGGVASARNTGINESKGEYVAFLDSDDLWHPTKIAKQLALLEARGPETALVYSPFRRIDGKGMVHLSSRNHRVEGWVINRHFYVNIVGNGSSVLIRKRVLEELGGFSSVLLQENAQGCEDFLLQLRIALRYRFATVPEYLVGYRFLPGNMSADEERMLRSGLLAMFMVLAECPNFPELARRGLVAKRIWEYLNVTMQRRHFKKGLAFILPHLKGRWTWVVRAAWMDMVHKFARFYRRNATRPAWPFQTRTILHRHFYQYDPTDMNYSDHLPTTREAEEADEIYRNLAALAPLDAIYHPAKYFGGEIASAAERRQETAAFL